MRPDRTAAAWLLAWCACAVAAPVDPDTGLVMAPGWKDVRAHCGACHSLGLVTQNRGDEAHWRATIRWMQDTQGLWDLGPAEESIVDYLAGQYASPELRPRRRPLAGMGSE